MDFQGLQGGRGSCLAVTMQGPGNDGIYFTADDIYEADLNAEPAYVSADTNPDPGAPGGDDRVRPFWANHPGGANFIYADGSTRFVSESIDRRTYVLQSYMNSGFAE